MKFELEIAAREWSILQAPAIVKAINNYFSGSLKVGVCPLGNRPPGGQDG